MLPDGSTNGPVSGINPPDGSPGVGSISGILAPDESPNDILAENSPTTSATSAVTGIFVAGSIVGSLIVANTGAAASAGFLAGAGTGGTSTITNPKSGSGSGHSVIDAVTLLLHFQSISTSGLLSISYPALYRFFSYNFAWANLVIGSSTFTDIAQNLGANPSCLNNLGSLQGPDLTDDPYSPSGMTVLGVRYGLSRATLGGLVYLSAIIGVAAVLAVSVLVNLTLRLVNHMFSNRYEDQVRMWPSRASSISLRLVSRFRGYVCTVLALYSPCLLYPSSSGFLVQ